MYWLINFLALAIVEIFIVDISGAIRNLIHPLVKKIFNIRGNIHIPLIECSMCVVFHTGWIFLLCTGEFTLVNFLITTLIAFISKNIAGCLNILQETLVVIENLIYKVLDK